MPFQKSNWHINSPIQNLDFSNGKRNLVGLQNYRHSTAAKTKKNPIFPETTSKSAKPQVKTKGKKRREEAAARQALTSLGVEEHERLVQRDGVVIGRRRRVVAPGDGLGDPRDDPCEHRGGDNHPDGPDEELAADDEAPDVDVLLLLLAALVPGPGQQPALLRLVERPRQRAAVDVQVPAPVVVRRRVVAYLKRPAPRVPPVHTHLAPASTNSSLMNAAVPMYESCWTGRQKVVFRPACERGRRRGGKRGGELS
jgi:hypothetical protein